MIGTNERLLFHVAGGMNPLEAEFSSCILLEHRAVASRSRCKNRRFQSDRDSEYLTL